MWLRYFLGWYHTRGMGGPEVSRPQPGLDLWRSYLCEGLAAAREGAAVFPGLVHSLGGGREGNLVVLSSVDGAWASVVEPVKVAKPRPKLVGKISFRLENPGCSLPSRLSLRHDAPSQRTREQSNFRLIHSRVKRLKTGLACSTLTNSPALC